MNVKKVTRSGGIGIPVGVRRALGLRPGDALDVETDGEGRVILSRHLPRCVFCGGEEAALQLGDKTVCTACAAKIVRSMEEERSERDGQRAV